MRSRVARSVSLGSCLAALLLFAGSASAATRYAAPGGAGSDPCASPASPCSVYTAADGGAPGTTLEAGDVVELAPGTYSEAAGDLGPSDYVNPLPGVTVRGAPGKARPVVMLQTNDGFWGAFFIGTAATLAGVEIRNQATNGSALTIQSGTVERVLAKSTVSSSFTCTFFEGTMLSSACLNEAGGAAIGVSVATAPGVHASVIRNSTAIATGPGSVGMDFAYFASSDGVIGAVNAIGVIAKGEQKDVIARGLEFSGGKGATTSIELQASDFATVQVQSAGTGSASVTEPGTNGNITALPLLAADNVHQLALSPTIGKGAVDGASAALDIDGDARTVDEVPDIGADEYVAPVVTPPVDPPSSSGGSSPSDSGPETPAVASAPQTRLTKHPRARTRKRLARFVFAADQPGVRFQCKLDNQAFRACSSPFKRRVGIGRHRFKVRAVGPGGIADVTPAKFSWRVLPPR